LDVKVTQLNFSPPKPTFFASFEISGIDVVFYFRRATHAIQANTMTASGHVIAVALGLVAATLTPMGALVRTVLSV
jgi:hypothetical protein